METLWFRSYTVCSPNTNLRFLLLNSSSLIDSKIKARWW